MSDYTSRLFLHCFFFKADWLSVIPELSYPETTKYISTLFTYSAISEAP